MNEIEKPLEREVELLKIRREEVLYVIVTIRAWVTNKIDRHNLANALTNRLNAIEITIKEIEKEIKERLGNE